MDQYVTGAVIKRLREEKNMTQQQLADKLSVSAKTISKWETAKGYPDITLLESIANALSVSVTELISDNTIVNSNVSANMLRSHFYVCPVCGNIVHSMGETVIQYMKLKAENAYNKNAVDYLAAKKRKFKQIAKLNKHNYKQ